MESGETNYQELLKQELENLVKEEKDKGKEKGKENSDKSKLTLQEKLESKRDELKLHLFEKEQNPYLYVLLNNSLFFIKGNEFRDDSYFSLIKNKIYKYIYELLLNPCDKQFIEFQSSFQNLDNGGDIIYLLSCKICDKLEMGKFDLFFSLVIKENIYRLEQILKIKNLTVNHSKIINKLKTFKIIKSDLSKVSVENAFNFFLEVISNPDSEKINGEINLALNQENENKDKIEKVNNPTSPSMKNANNPKSANTQNQTEKLDTNKNEVIKKEENNISNAPQENNNIHISLPNENIFLNKFLEYLKETKKIYDNISPTPVLDYLINNGGKLKLKYFRYKGDKDSYIDHLYENLKEFVKNLNNGDFNIETQGYLCFKDETTGVYVESLYSIVELKLLFNKISSNENFPKDDFKNPDKIKAKNAFKSRALSFEYYINYNIIIDKFKLKERPRVIYPFKSLDAIEKNEEDQEKSYNLIEVDGVILEKKGYNLALKENAFIIDELYKLEEFVTSNSQKVIKPYIEKSIDLKENELCIIEIKNQFPPSSDELTEKYDQNEKQPTTFFQMVKGLIKKAKIFKQLCDFKNEKVDHIRLILFYDAIQKENYYEDLKKAFEESFEENDKSQLIYEFQCIYIKSSYLAAGLFNMFYKYDFLSYTNKSLNEKIEKLDNENSMLKKYIEGFKQEYIDVIDKLKNQGLKTSEEILTLKKELNKSQKNKLEETSKLNEEIIKYSEEIEKIKSELIDYQKKNSQEIIKLKEENNKYSAQILELKKDFAHKINEKSNEIVGLKKKSIN